MKRKVSIILILILIIGAITCNLIGCSAQNSGYKEHKPEYGPQFMLLESYHDPYIGDVEILVDKNTRVMYIYLSYCDNESNGKALSVLYDSEGKVRRYSGAIIE